jgi:hypothetical protein
LVEVVESPLGDRIAYADCIEMTDWICTADIIVEAPDGTGHGVLATVTLRPSDLRTGVVEFTRDGQSLITLDDPGDGPHLLVRPLTGGDPVDIGAAGDTTFLRWGAFHGGSLLSVDEREILVVRGDVLSAVSLDGTGERVVFDSMTTCSGARYAAFMPDGTIVLEWEVNAENPPDDTLECLASTVAVRPDGIRVDIRGGESWCRLAALSAAGTFVGFSCGDDAPVHRVADGSLVLETGASQLLGFDALELGAVVAAELPQELLYAPLDGSPVRLLFPYGTWRSGSGPIIDGPSFHYRP